MAYEFDSTEFRHRRNKLKSQYYHHGRLKSHWSQLDHRTVSIFNITMIRPWAVGEGEKNGTSDFERVQGPFLSRRDEKSALLSLENIFGIYIEFDYQCVHCAVTELEEKHYEKRLRMGKRHICDSRDAPTMFLLLSIQFSREFMCQKLQTASVTKNPCSTATWVCVCVVWADSFELCM